MSTGFIDIYFLLFITFSPTKIQILGHNIFLDIFKFKFGSVNVYLGLNVAHKDDLKFSSFLKFIFFLGHNVCTFSR